MDGTTRRAIACLLYLLLSIACGLAVRYAPLHLPWFWYKYLGSALWAVAVYWCAAMLLPRERVGSLARLAAAISLLVEFSRLTPERHVDAFRLTLAGRLLLGRFFSWKNIVAYLAGVALAALLDSRYRPGRAGGRR